MPKKTKAKKHDFYVKPDKDYGIKPEKITTISGIFLDVLLLVISVILISKLSIIASNSMFFTDECFHSYIVKLTAENKRVPGILPDIHAATKNNQPPLFHAIAAIYSGLFGENSLKYFNVFLLFIFLGVIYGLIRYFINANSARLSTLLIMTSFLILQYSVVFYLEIISAITFFVAIFLLTIALEKRKKSFYVYAGVAGMLLLVSKVTSIIIIPFYALVFVYYLIRLFLKREKFEVLIGIGIIIGVSVISTVIFFILVTDSPLSFTEKLFIAPVKSLILPFISTGNLKTGDEVKIISAAEAWTIKDKGILLKLVLSGTGIPIITGLICALAYSVIKFRGSKIHLSLFFILYGFLIFLFSPASADRHFIALLPLASFAGGYSINEIGSKLNDVIFGLRTNKITQFLRAICTVIIITFLVIFIYNAVKIKKIGDLRLPLNASIQAMLPAIEYIRDNTDDDSFIFTMWAYETLYYSGRRSAWGENSKGMRKICFIKNTDEFFEQCKEFKITHFLMDNSRILPDEKYNTVVYTKTIAENLLSLIRDGRAEISYPVRISSDTPDLQNIHIVPVIPQGMEKNENNISAYKFAVITPQGAQPIWNFFVITIK